MDGLLRFHASFALAQPSLIVVQGRELSNVPEPARHEIRRLQREYVECWVGVRSELSPDAAVSRLRVAVHAAFGLLNSTPYALGGAATPDSADLLVTMARAALLSSG